MREPRYSPYFFEVTVVVRVLSGDEVAGNNLALGLTGRARLEKAVGLVDGQLRDIDRRLQCGGLRRRRSRIAAIASGLPSKPTITMFLSPADATAAAAPSAMVSLPAMMPVIDPFAWSMVSVFWKASACDQLADWAETRLSPGIAVENGVKPFGADLSVGVGFPAKELRIVALVCRANGQTLRQPGARPGRCRR